jgi:hypothetical protein
MAWTDPTTKATGDLITAAYWNQMVGPSGNIAATGPGIVTTAGDLVYATADNTLARLASSGGGNKFLQMNSGATAPSWETALTSLVADTTPQLGGFLDANGQYIQMQKGGDISSASPTVIDTDGDYFICTGTTSFSALTVAADRHFFLEFAGALTITHGAGTIDLPGGANITTAAGDVAEFVSTAANVVTCVNYTKADGTAVVAAGGLFASWAFIVDQKANATDSGTFTQGAWRTRDLNTEIADADGIVSISSNELTLAAGSYLIQWSAPAYQVNVHQTRLYDVTGTAVIHYGTSAFTHDTNSTTNRSFGAARVTPSGSNAYKIEHRCSNTISNEGFGAKASFGNVINFTEVLIMKES